jgi:hypothetical protein
MPISQFLGNSKFDPETRRIIAHWHCGTGHSCGAVRDCFAEQVWREPAISAVLCGSNGLSGGGVDISRIGIRRIDFLGRDMVVRLWLAIPRGLCLVFAIFVTSADQ